jgi:hypothetical protein
MGRQYSFLDKDKSTESANAEMEPQVRAKINLWIYVSWAFAALYLIIAIQLAKISIVEDWSAGFWSLYCIIIAIFSGVGGVLVKKKDYELAWMCWKIAGFLGLVPFGFVLLIGRFLTKKLIKKIEEQEFQKMLNKTK